MTNRLLESTEPTMQPEIYSYDNVVFKVGTFFSQQSSDTLKDILERTIKREALAKIKSEKV